MIFHLGSHDHHGFLASWCLMSFLVALGPSFFSPLHWHSFSDDSHSHDDENDDDTDWRPRWSLREDGNQWAPMDLGFPSRGNILYYFSSKKNPPLLLSFLLVHRSQLTTKLAVLVKSRRYASLIALKITQNWIKTLTSSSNNPHTQLLALLLLLSSSTIPILIWLFDACCLIYKSEWGTTVVWVNFVVFEQGAQILYHGIILLKGVLERSLALYENFVGRDAQRSRRVFQWKWSAYKCDKNHLNTTMNSKCLPLIFNFIFLVHRFLHSENPPPPNEQIVRYWFGARPLAISNHILKGPRGRK